MTKFAEPMNPGLLASAASSLDQRSRDIFKLIVESYLSEGEPVGSRNLSRILPHSLSPATIRNVMSDLENLGLIYAPHVSAGRMPTQTGLRFFVDGVMEIGDLSSEERRNIETQIKASGEGKPVENLLTEASQLLSGLSRGAGVVLATNISSSSGWIRPRHWRCSSRSPAMWRTAFLTFPWASHRHN
jgi:heat-inducible transcriptional repressor